MQTLKILIATLATDEIEKCGGKWPAVTASIVTSIFGVILTFIGITALFETWEPASLAKVCLGIVGLAGGLLLIIMAGAIIYEIVSKK